MAYTPQQLEIIRRMADLSKQINETAAAHRRAQSVEPRKLRFSDAIASLEIAMNYSTEMHRLCTEHGDAFREFLDTLGN
jgi:hypothetical protein